jgi:hypothetical protein
MAGDKLNSRGGSFLPKGDDFLQGVGQSRARKNLPPPTQTAYEEDFDTEAPLGNPPGFDEEENFTPLGRTTEVPKGPLGAPADTKAATPPLAGTPSLAGGLNGVPEMKGGLPEVFKREADILGLVLSEDDIMQYITKGSVSKEVALIKNLLSARIRTLTTEEVGDVNMRMSKELQQHPEMINKEYMNKSTMYMFGYAVEALGKPGALKALPKVYEERLKQIWTLAPQVVAKLTHRYNLLEFLVQDRISDEEFIKN